MNHPLIALVAFLSVLLGRASVDGWQTVVVFFAIFLVPIILAYAAGVRSTKR
jgi:hypothetical protein